MVTPKKYYCEQWSHLLTPNEVNKMNNKELDSILFKLDWNNTEASKNLCVSRRSLLRWLSSTRKIPPYIEKLLLVSLELKELKLKQTKTKDKKRQIT